MLNVTQAEVQNAGGFLAALIDKSCEYVRRIIPGNAVRSSAGKEESLERIIVHTSPHLDEYFGELVFRACLPEEKRRCDFIEQSIFSKDNDLACQLLWPTAAVLGIGAAVSGGARALYLFDEHVAGQAKTAPSCSKLVIDTMLSTLPASLAPILNEVNVIDEYGGAHEQHLGNLIKLFHEVFFAFKLDPSSDDVVRDTLTPDWKRSLVDVCLCSVIYCLEEQIDIVGNPTEKKNTLIASLENYAQKSSHRSHPKFGDALQSLRSLYGDQAKVFVDAVLKDRKGPIVNASGDTTPQLLIMSRILFACEKCWGENVRDIVGAHFWEVALQKNLNFYPVRNAVDEMFKKGVNRLVSPVGFLRSAVLNGISLGQGRKGSLWIISIVPDTSVFFANQGVMNFINQNNSVGKNNRGGSMGCGLVLVQDTVRGTSALFKCAGVPDDKWEKLVNLIKMKEDECWHVIYAPSGEMAPFILNGNKAHQHVPRTGLDLTSLTRLVERTFY